MTPAPWDRPTGTVTTGPPPPVTDIWADQPERTYPCSTCGEPIGETEYTTHHRRGPSGRLCSPECCTAWLHRHRSAPGHGLGPMTVEAAVKTFQARGFSYATQAPWWGVDTRTVERWGSGK